MADCSSDEDNCFSSEYDYDEDVNAASDINDDDNPESDDSGNYDISVGNSACSVSDKNSELLNMDKIELIDDSVKYEVLSNEQVLLEQHKTMQQVMKILQVSCNRVVFKLP